METAATRSDHTLQVISQKQPAIRVIGVIRGLLPDSVTLSSIDIGPGPDPAGPLDLASWRQTSGPPAHWSESLTSPENEAMLARLRRCTMRGCPLGSDSYLSKPERPLGRRLRPLPLARPKKTGKKRPKKL